MTKTEQDVLKIIIRARWSDKMIFDGMIADELGIKYREVINAISKLKLNEYLDHLGATDKAFAWAKTL